jgi:Ni/Co efflux regulator RcnB
MKSLIYTVVAASVVAAPFASFAQSNEPLTRAQVQDELVQLEKAGFKPVKPHDADYPARIQAAQARVAVQRTGAGAQ